MPGSIDDLLTRVTDSTTGRPVVALLASPGKALAAASININDATNWTTTTAVHFSIYETQVLGGVTVKNSTTQTDWKGVLSGTTISGLVLTGGTDRAYTAGAIVEITPTARYAKDLYDWGAVHADSEGNLLASAVQEALNLGSASLNGWNPLGYTAGTVTNNGNRSYDLVFAGQDLTSTLSPGMRLRTQRTVAASTQCTDLEASSSQYASKSSPSGITFTDDFTCEAWVKLESYVAGTIVSRRSDTSGWALRTEGDGRVYILGYNGSTANFRRVTSYQSLPLNKWVHVAAKLDMSGSAGTIWIDGVSVPTVFAQSGTNPSSLIQAGNLQVGAIESLVYFDGKISDVRVWSALRSTPEILANMSQALTGSETGLVAYFKLNGDFNDSTANANHLTASGGATATDADAPFGGQASGSVSSTLDYGIIQKATFSTDTTVTVQVAEGCTIPTSGGVASVSYSTQRSPYGFPGQRGKWVLESLFKASTAATGTTSWVNLAEKQIALPVGEWTGGYKDNLSFDRAASFDKKVFITLSTATTSETDNSATNYVGISTTLAQNTFYNWEVFLNDYLVTNTAQTNYYLLIKSNAATGNTAYANTASAGYIRFFNAYL